MKRRRRTETTIETYEVLAIRASRGPGYSTRWHHSLGSHTVYGEAPHDSHVPRSIEHFHKPEVLVKVPFRSTSCENVHFSYSDMSIKSRCSG
jgi:hypothetical protein